MSSSVENATTAPGKPVAEGGDPAKVSARLPPFAPGAIVADKYEVERELAEGGLGIVVVASQLELGRPVAIKYLKPNVLASPVLVERFKREAKLASSIRSDHVVRIYDVGVHPTGGPYMVMEYLEGEDLGDRVSRGPLPIHEAIDYIVQACDALAEAHAFGIVHRDLKPENMFLARRPGAPPIVKILDFGISKVTERKTTPDGVRTRGITEDGARLGTPVYMSPEQLLADRPVDTRTDIWSLGVVLFELITGVLPFEGESVPHLAANIVGAAPLPLRSKLPDATPALEAVIAKCLEKNPEARYRNVAELVEELVRFEAPLSQARVGRIRHVVSHGGDSIRPPRPLSTPDADFIVPGLPPSASAPPSTTSPSATPMSVTPHSSPPAPRRFAWGQAVAALVMLVAAIGITIAIVGRRNDPPAPAVVNSIPPPTPTVLAPPSPVVVPAASPTPSAAPSASAAPARPAAPPPQTPQAPQAPKKPKNDYSDFGDRR